MRYLPWLLLWGCEPGSTDPTPASVTLLQPAEGAVVCGAPLVVEVEVEGLLLVDPYDPPDPLPPDSGHLDMELNGQAVAMTAEERVELTDVADGKYLLLVELSDSNHDPIDPPADASALFQVDSSTCPDRTSPEP